MKKMSKITFIALLTLILSATFIQAQKFGYLNSSQLLAELPSVREADSQLEVYQKQLISAGENMVKQFQANLEAYNKDVNEGVLSQIQMKDRETKLATEQQNIQNYEFEVQQKITKKREELYQPILDKVRNAVTELGTSEGYTMIFDSSAGAILHANDSENVMDKVKAKLGL